MPNTHFYEEDSAVVNRSPDELENLPTTSDHHAFSECPSDGAPLNREPKPITGLRRRTLRKKEQKRKRKERQMAKTHKPTSWEDLSPLIDNMAEVIGAYANIAEQGLVVHQGIQDTQYGVEEQQLGANVATLITDLEKYGHQVADFRQRLDGKSGEAKEADIMQCIELGSDILHATQLVMNTAQPLADDISKYIENVTIPSPTDTDVKSPIDAETKTPEMDE